MALIVAGERSGVGKTTVTLALLAYLYRRQLQVQSFKVGPDYIDPMFHQYVTKRPCRNLDPVLTSETYVQQCFAYHAQGVDCALVEGVMGLFDGVQAKKQLAIANCPLPTSFASTAHIARLLDLPVILAIDCSRLSGSVAAIARGYGTLDPQIKLAGVVLNRVGSDRHLQLLKDALAAVQIPILGVLRRQDNITIPDRHLGLVPTAELPQLDTLVDRLATSGETCFDWDKLLPLLESQTSKVLGADLSKLSVEKSKLSVSLVQKSKLPHQLPIRIALARDRAFNFYYQDNLDLLQSLGAELVPWSPLVDCSLPKNIHGLYFGGGFPEVFASQLAENTSAIAAVQAAIQAGMPTYAECGGLMYLCQHLVDFDGKSWSMVGAIPTQAVMGSRLTLGYRQATALQDSPLLNVGNVVWGHEFHRSHLSIMPAQPLYATRPRDERSPVTLEGWRSSNLHASYIHLHFGEHPDVAARFLHSCANWRAIMNYK